MICWAHDIEISRFGIILPRKLATNKAPNPSLGKAGTIPRIMKESYTKQNHFEPNISLCTSTSSVDVLLFLRTIHPHKNVFNMTL